MSEKRHSSADMPSAEPLSSSPQGPPSPEPGGSRLAPLNWAAESGKENKPEAPAAGTSASRVDHPHDGSQAGRVSRQQRELLLQASQIAEQLQEQSNELDRREQHLNEQLAALDQERRNLRFRVQQFEQEMLDREEKLAGQEADFQNRIAACEKLVSELEQQDHELKKTREALEAERDRLREEVNRELEVDRAALQQARGALEMEREDLRKQVEQHRREHDETLQRSLREVEEERGRLREQLAADLERERAEFEQQRREWSAQRDAEMAEIQHERDINETALRRAHQELLDLQQRRESEAEQQKKELQASLDQMRRQFEQEQERRKAEWEARRDAELAEIERERELHEAAVRQSQEELEQEKQRHQQQSAEQRRLVEQEREAERERLKQERAVLENRVRFEQTHIQKSRQELEAGQRELRQEQQIVRAQLEQDRALLRHRAEQLNHFRALLDEREQSFEREQRLLANWRRTVEADAKRERQRLSQQRGVWEQEREAQQAEVRRQHDMLTLHAENLEGRRARLDQLREELEETHRHTLEMRIAVEETWAQVSQAAGSDAARQRVQEARRALSDHYQQLRDWVAQQRRELAEAQELLQRHRDEFYKERRQLTEWIQEREEKLRSWDERLRRESGELDARDAAWVEARNNWMQEKLTAERVIRNLLAQLNEQNGTEASIESVTAPASANVASGETADGGTTSGSPASGPHWNRSRVRSDADL